MRLALTFLGWDLFTAEISRGEYDRAPERGDAISNGFGFVACYDRPDDVAPEDR